MTRIVTLIGLGVVAVATFGQGQDQRDRTETILNKVRERANQQNDIWFTLGDFPRDIQSLRVLQAMFPHDYELETDVGWMEENIEDYSEAIGTYIAYRKAWPQDPDACFPEASFYFREHLYAKVPPIIEPSLKLSTRPFANSYRILASAYEKMGLFTDSLRVWDAYLAFAKDDGQAKLNRARVEKKRLAVLPLGPR